MKELHVGPCPICDVQIWEEKPVVIDGESIKKIVLKDNGMHFWVKSNYGSKMKIAICKDCFKKLDDAKVAAIIDNIVYTWLKELFAQKDISEEKMRPNFIKARFYVAVKWGENEEDL